MSSRLPEMTDHGDGITAIDTALLRPQFDASHLIVEAGRAAFVDTGVNDSVPLLLAALKSKDLDPADVDYVFLTHVHLDHAGGAGLLMEVLPNAKAVLHPYGAPHMIDPAKLISGARAVYGKEEYDRQYGEIRAIAEQRIIVVADDQALDLGGRRLRCLFTEGHARHHYCLSDERSEAVFTGDSFGVSFRELDTVKGEFIYPTTTPIHFDPPEAHKAIDRIMALAPTALYLTHYSRVTDVTRLAVDMHDRIDAFVELAMKHANDEERTRKLQDSMLTYLLYELRQHGHAGDDHELQDVLLPDVVLNTMGLEFWLEHSQGTT